MPVRIRMLWAATILLFMALAVPAARAVTEPGPVGDWLTEGGHGVIRIAPCGGALCGRIVGIDREPNEPMPTDVHGNPQCGLTIIQDAMPNDDDIWEGHITDPRNGDVYGARLWTDEQGNLHLRGYLGIPLLGETQVWHRFTGQITRDCAVG
jgi:uncharacterized protein (DUF2147 family)